MMGDATLVMTRSLPSLAWIAPPSSAPSTSESVSDGSPVFQGTAVARDVISCSRSPRNSHRSATTVADGQLFNSRRLATVADLNSRRVATQQLHPCDCQQLQAGNPTVAGGISKVLILQVISR